MKKTLMRQVVGEKGFNGKNIQPNIVFTDSELPDLDSYEIGKKYSLVVEVELVAVRKGSEYQHENADKRTRGTFKVTSVAPEEPYTEDYEQEYARRRSSANRL